MTVLYVLVPLMIAFATGAVIAFIWAVRGGQLDDLDTPPLRILGDDGAGSAPAAGRRTVAIAPVRPEPI